MSIDFILPDIGEGIVECEIVEWLVKAGDSIVEDQPICEVMTDKAMVQIPAIHTGVIDKLYYNKGEIAKVHQPLFAMTPTEIASEVTKPSEITTITNRAMTEDFLLPDIGEGIVECEVINWLVKEGDMINEDQTVCEVMTDKAVVEIPSKYQGKITKLYTAQGSIAKVHQPLFSIEIASEEVENTNTIANKIAPISNIEIVTKTTPQYRGKAVASPAVRRLARERNIELNAVSGSGKNGRVYKEDLFQYEQRVQQTHSNKHNDIISHTIQAQTIQTASPVQQTHALTRTEKITGMQAAMAKQMVTASLVPHFTYSEEIDVTELVQLRQRLKTKAIFIENKLTMLPFLIKSLSLSLADFPVLNSQVNTDCSEITFIAEHNIGIAVDGKKGLIVPNIKNCQLKSIVDITTEVNRLIDAARLGRVTAEDLKQGTISISNIGAIGGTVASPIINVPEVAIVAVGKIQTLPRFNDNGDVVKRQIMQVSWAGDHRVIDGGTIARFCNRWKALLEDPSEMLLNLK